MPFFVWIAISLAILIIAGNAGRGAPPVVIQPGVPSVSQGSSIFGYLLAVLIITVAVAAYLKYRKGSG
ncbi:MAG TPA: hypothetical protein DET40_04985 [Lentisphaeria bacterium]|nr:MAG: hypothetical protein A2X45_13560 [Lentisphaerae bacterium GWF2_50_93]HCE42881.1 hypothetical protein [Lentisphaeria bacterium]